MNAPLDQAVLSAIAKVSLDDKYTLDHGRAYMSGTQALVRLPMLQKMRDKRNGLNTAGFISGYRGSPLGALDQALWKAKVHLKEHDIVFQPGLNEDLAATSIWGTQQVTLYPDATHDGVFGMWYGKGPGVDRSMDVFKHANSAGTARPATGSGGPPPGRPAACPGPRQHRHRGTGAARPRRTHGPGRIRLGGCGHGTRLLWPHRPARYFSGH